jgi:hypothetical protein
MQDATTCPSATLSGVFKSRTVAATWEEAMVSGNGRQGVLCHGEPGALRFTLSHEQLFLPADRPLDPPDTAAILPELRGMLLSGWPQLAADRVCQVAVHGEPAYQDLRWIDSFVGAATIAIQRPERGPAQDYHRATDPDTGVVLQRWRDDGGIVSVAAFASRPHDTVVIWVRGTGLGGATLRPIEGTPPVPVEFSTAVGPRSLTLRARFPGRWPGAIPGYAVACRLLVDVPRELVLLARTAVGDVEPEDVLAELAALPDDYLHLLAAHASVQRDLFTRTHLDLKAGADRDECTEDLLAGPVGPALIETLFDAGRYAIISSCGERPPNLQGVWSGTYRPAWASGHTLDGNLQAAVAALLPTRTPELLLPLFDLLDDFVKEFRSNARRLYGVRGLLTPVHVSTHGRQNHFGPVWCQTFWTAGAAWLSRFYWDYWRYTGDRRFLAGRALPFMAEAARFYLDFVDWRSGVATFVPSYSPENSPASTGSQATINSTMDIGAVSDLLRNLEAAVQELGVDHPDRARWAELLAGLPPYRINAAGELAEWAYQGLEDNHAHRHASHLYPLWYELDPAFAASPELRAAAGRAIEARLEFWRRAPGLSGETADEMAYGLVQLGIAAAQLGLAGPAYEAVERLTRYWRPSLVATHNLGQIFNVDICGGLPALVLAMLVRSGDHRVDLLPALPSAWPAGEVRGVGCRDRLTVRRLAWAPGSVEAELESAVDAHVTVGLPDGERSLRLRAGKPVAVRGGR